MANDNYPLGGEVSILTYGALYERIGFGRPSTAAAAGRGRPGRGRLSWAPAPSVRHGHGVGLEQYLAVDPEGPDGGLAFGPDQPVDDRLARHCHVNRIHYDIAVNRRWSPYAFSVA